MPQRSHETPAGNGSTRSVPYANVPMTDSATGLRVSRAATELGLVATDEIVATNLELEVHGGEVATEGEDLQADALLLDARARGPRHPRPEPLGVPLATPVVLAGRGPEPPPAEQPGAPSA